MYHQDYVKHELGSDQPRKPERFSKAIEHVKRNQEVEEQIKKSEPFSVTIDKFSR